VSSAFHLDARDGSRFSKSDVEAVSEVLAAIEKELGQLGSPTEQASELLARSRPKDSPTHHLFEWDNRKAAEAHRLHRARDIISSVRVIFDERPGVPVRAFPIITTNGKRNYTPMARVLESREATQMLVEQFKAEAERWVRRYEHLRKVAELAPFFAGLDKVLAKTKRSRAKAA
jgi:hypothetical protein